MVRMQDVAERAGVSLKTVSNVVNGFASIRPSTRERVQQALTDLGYRPNMAARSLAGGRTGLISLVIPDTDSSYFGRLTGALIKAARDADLSILIQSSGRTVPGELSTLSDLRRHFVDGMIGNTVALSDDQIKRQVGGVPVVMLGNRWDGQSTLYDHVHPDVETAGADGVNHLIECGRRRIALLGCRDEQIAPTDARLRGAERALADHRLSPLYGRVGASTRDQGYRAMLELFRAEPTVDGVFCFNDDLAVGAMAAIGDRGRRVPGDVAVVGFDDTAMARFTTPTLTSIHYDMARMASEVVRRLCAAIDRNPEQAADYRGEDVIIPHRLEIRGSTVPNAIAGAQARPAAAEEFDRRDRPV